MPYKDPEKQREAKRQSARRQRALKGRGLKPMEPASTLPEPPSRDELLKALGVQAREGNVPAIRLLLEEYRRDGNDDEAEKVTSVIDELAKRRTGRAA